jgi:hypothetical protein
MLDVSVAFVGGLIDRESIFTRLLRDEILRRCPESEVHPPRNSPEHGAVRLAIAHVKDSSP